MGRSSLAARRVENLDGLAGGPADYLVRLPPKFWMERTLEQAILSRDQAKLPPWNRTRRSAKIDAQHLIPSRIAENREADDIAPASVIRGFLLRGADGRFSGLRARQGRVRTKP